MDDTIHYSASRGGFFSAALHGALPPDAVAITHEAHAALLDGQASGRRIVAGPGGAPILADAPPAPAEALAAGARAERDRRLVATDWTQLPDAPLSAGQRTAWAAYRAALRALPDQPGWPTTHTWPEEP